MKRQEAIEWTWLFLVGALGLILFASWAEIIKCLIRHWFPEESRWQFCVVFAIIITVVIAVALIWIINTRYPLDN